MAQPPKKRTNEPEPRPIIVKKIIVEEHGAHHGGAWKVAYADFVTAMMAFFLLMWLLGATTEQQRKGLADYFTPTLVQLKMDSAGSSGLFGGDSLTSKDNYPTTGGQGNLAITIPRDATGTRDVGGDDLKDRDRTRFEMLKQKLDRDVAAEKALKRLRRHIRFTESREGLRIDLIDEADFAMFAMGTDRLVPEAEELLRKVAKVINGVPNTVIVRGHTDGLPYSAGQSMNNWLLSSSRAEATRAFLARNGVPNERFERIEGVADRDPFIPNDRYDPRNRRMSIVLTWSRGLDKALDEQAEKTEELEPYPIDKQEVQHRILVRESQSDRLRKEARRLDLGSTALPAGAVPVNANDIPQRNRTTPPGQTEGTTHRLNQLNAAPNKRGE